MCLVVAFVHVSFYALYPRLPDVPRVQECISIDFELPITLGIAV
jgi:hypothetical protein